MSDDVTSVYWNTHTGFGSWNSCDPNLSYKPLEILSAERGHYYVSVYLAGGPLYFNGDSWVINFLHNEFLSVDSWNMLLIRLWLDCLEASKGTGTSGTVVTISTFKAIYDPLLRVIYFWWVHGVKGECEPPPLVGVLDVFYKHEHKKDLFHFILLSYRI